MTTLPWAGVSGPAAIFSPFPFLSLFLPELPPSRRIFPHHPSTQETGRAGKRITPWISFKKKQRFPPKEPANADGSVPTPEFAWTLGNGETG